MAYPSPAHPGECRDLDRKALRFAGWSADPTPASPASSHTIWVPAFAGMSGSEGAQG